MGGWRNIMRCGYILRKMIFSYYFAGFQYSTSQSVIGTIDIDGNVEITESTPNPITNIIQIN